MKKLLSFIASDSYLDQIGDGWNELDKILQEHRLDGIETMTGGYYKPENIEMQEWLGLSWYRSGYTDAAIQMWESILTSESADSLLMNRLEILKQQTGVSSESRDGGRATWVFTREQRLTWLEEVRADFPLRSVRVAYADGTEPPADLPGILHSDKHEGTWRLTLDEDEAPSDLLDRLRAAGPLTLYSANRPSLSEIFLEAVARNRGEVRS